MKLLEAIKNANFLAGLKGVVEGLTKDSTRHSTAIEAIRSDNIRMLEQIAELDKETRKIPILEERNTNLQRQVDRMESTMQLLLTGRLAPSTERVVSDVPFPDLEETNVPEPQG